MGFYVVKAKIPAGYWQAGRKWGYLPETVQLNERDAALIEAEPEIDIHEATPEELKAFEGEPEPEPKLKGKGRGKKD